MNDDVEDAQPQSTEAEPPFLDLIEAAMLKTNDGDYVGAIADCENALRLDPEAAEPYFVLGIVAMTCHDEGQALEMLEVAHQADPETREYAEALGVIYTRVGQLVDGLYYSKLAMALTPHHLFQERMPSMLRDLASAYHNVSPSTHRIEAERLYNIAKYDLARRECEAEVKLDPKNKEAYFLLGRVNHALQRYERAVGACQAAIHLDPTDGLPIARLARTLVCLGRFDEAAACAQHALRTSPEDPAVYGAAMDALLRCPNFPFETARALADEHCARIAAALADDFATPPEVPEGKVRIGLMSNAFFDTPDVKLASTLVKVKPAKSIEFRGYAISVASDNTTTVIRNRCDEWREIFDLDPFTLGLTMKGEALDVLLDLSSPEWDTRLGLATMSPAPVRVGTQALPDPALMPGVTHVLSDETLVSADRRTLRGNQNVIEVPGTLFACEPFDEIPQDLEAPVSINGTVTYGGMLDLARLSADCVALWSEILQATTGSKLLLCASKPPTTPVRTRAIEMFSHYGVANRLLFPTTGEDENEEEPLALGQRLPLEQWKAIDVFLDTVPFNGGQELAEALWAGIPVVSLMGDRRASAVGASMLSAAGRVNWIARDRADYQRIAASLGSDRDELSRARSTLQTQMAGSLLFDTAELARNLVGALEKTGRAARPAAGGTEE